MGSDRSGRRGGAGASTDVARRRLLVGLGAVGAAGLAGCRTMSPFTDREFEQYACTDIDDEPMERYEPSGADLPFSFAKPEPMTREDVTDAEAFTRLELKHIWTQPGEMGAQSVDHQIFLRMLLSRNRAASKSEYWKGRQGTAVGELQYGGETTRIVALEESAESARVAVLLPTEGGDDGAYDSLRIEVDAVLGGGSQEAQQRETDPAQTCGEAVRNVAVAVARSVEPG